MNEAITTYRVQSEVHHPHGWCNVGMPAKTLDDAYMTTLAGVKAACPNRKYRIVRVIEETVYTDDIEEPVYADEEVSE